MSLSRYDNQEIPESRATMNNFVSLQYQTRLKLYFQFLAQSHCKFNDATEVPTKIERTL